MWGAERPALEIWTAILAFAPVIGWLGNPAWWRDTLPRLAHYYTISFNREGVLPDINIIYFGQVYFYSLPWHNGWVLLAITVPLAILAAAPVGSAGRSSRRQRDRLPLYFLVHFLTLPSDPDAAHPGTRRSAALSAHVLLSSAAFQAGGPPGWPMPSPATDCGLSYVGRACAMTGLVLGSVGLFARPNSSV